MTVQISPSIALAEARAEADYFRARSLIQAQAIADLKQQIAELQAAAADLAEDVRNG